MGKINIIGWNTAEDGELNEANLKKKMEKKGFTCVSHTFKPGTTFNEHSHGETKMDAVLSGSFEVGMYGETVEMGAGDMVEIPSGLDHTAKVLGSEEVKFVDGSK